MKTIALFLCLAPFFLSPVQPAETGRSECMFKELESSPGEFAFDTGVLRGTLRPGGKSMGLLSVVHVPSGTRLDSSNGLLSHYRVFTKGVRYGGGAWDWPSVARLQPDGSVTVHWPATNGRPFDLRATYRWNGPETLDLETTVDAQEDLFGFESFLANYFGNSFTNCGVLGQSTHLEGAPGELMPVAPQFGVWQMFPTTPNALDLIRDGRWKLEPNPVDWAIRPTLLRPVGVRQDPGSGLAIVLMSPAQDCFALSSPHQAEGHRSLYLSLFGKDLKAGTKASARTRLIVATKPSERWLLEQYGRLLPFDGRGPG